MTRTARRRATPLRPSSSSRSQASRSARRAPRRSPLRRAVGVIGGVLLGAFALGAVAVLVLSALGIARLVPVLSNSMAPEMPVGSLAVVLPQARAEIVEGDVIVFTSPDDPNRRVIHRITHVFGADEAQTLQRWSPDELTATTKGDNNESADPWIVTIADPTIWKQAEVVPLAGWPAIWLADPKARLVLFGALGAAITAWAIALVWRRPQEAGA